MKLNTQYNTNEIEVLGVEKSQAFGFSKDAQEMIFTMFTKNIYSNPIGSVVREITSNCFDSHKEAGVTDAVVIKLTQENGDYYISFIDKGVGMSRERMTTVYAQYFNSTKRDDNNQIGGFGIGGKTPLAYGDSFILITNYAGTKYTYSIRKGKTSPVLDLLSKEKTTEHNGTIVKVPIRSGDVSTFEREIIRQLYYFENVVFEGFSQTVTNDYKIMEGKNFLYRGSNHSSYMHICLGRVAYPIDYSVFDEEEVDKYDWEVPVALKIEIGEINVTASREAIDYTEATKKLIKKKMELAKQELIAMLTKQYEKLDSLEEFYELEDNYSNLRLAENHVVNIQSLLHDSRHKKPQFPKYGALNIPSQAQIIHMFYDVSLFGKKKKREKSSWDDSLRTVSQHSVYFTRDGEQMPRKTNAYLKATNNYFQTLTRKELTLSRVKEIVRKLTPDKSVASLKSILAQFNEFRKEVYKLVEKKTKHYSNVTVPDGWTMQLTKYDPKFEVPLGTFGWSKIYKERHTIADLLSSKKTYYFATYDDENIARFYEDVYGRLFKTPKYNEPSVQFVMVAKNNIKHVETLKNFKPISQAPKLFIRKRAEVMKFVERTKFMNMHSELSELFLNVNLFKVLDPAYGKTLQNLNRVWKKYDDMPIMDINVSSTSPILSLLNIKYDSVTYKGADLMEIVKEKTEKNGMLKYVRIYNDFDPAGDEYSKKEKNDIMLLLEVAYVK